MKSVCMVLLAGAALARRGDSPDDQLFVQGESYTNTMEVLTFTSGGQNGKSQTTNYGAVGASDGDRAFMTFSSQDLNGGMQTTIGLPEESQRPIFSSTLRHKNGTIQSREGLKAWDEMQEERQKTFSSHGRNGNRIVDDVSEEYGYREGHIRRRQSNGGRLESQQRLRDQEGSRGPIKGALAAVGIVGAAVLILGIVLVCCANACRKESKPTHPASTDRSEDLELQNRADATPAAVDAPE